MKLGLKLYESLLAMGIVTKEWVPTAPCNADGHLTPKFWPFQVTNIVLSGQDDEKITIEVQKMHKVTMTPWRQTLQLKGAGHCHQPQEDH